MESVSKPKHFKPGLYAMFYVYLKLIAEQYGYNLVVHGSMNRDLDLIAIPWDDRCCFTKEQLMIKEFQRYLTGITLVSDNNEVRYTTLPGGRHSYIIDLNRGDRHGEWVRFDDAQYYLDISVTQFVKQNKEEAKHCDLCHLPLIGEKGQIVCSCDENRK